MSTRIGELRPTQLLYTYGVGSVVDLPYVSTMVMGLEDWKTAYSREINEERLLVAVQNHLGAQVQRLLAPPVVPDTGGTASQLDERNRIGVPVSPFPRWMRCPWCNTLASINSGLFALKEDRYRPDRTKYVHEGCMKARKPSVVPARFLVACERGHLDDFPWMYFVHSGKECEASTLTLREYGVSGSAADVEVRCEKCGANRRMAEAFGEDARERNMPECSGRRPHLRDYDETECPKKMKSILLGASNSWFPIVLSSLSIPVSSKKLEQMVDTNWEVLGKANSFETLQAFRSIGQLADFAEYTDDDLWAAMEDKRQAATSGVEQQLVDLKTPEWRVLVQASAENNTADFRLRKVDPPERFRGLISQVVIAERLREVRALVSFTRIESPMDFEGIAEIPPEKQMALSRKSPEWVPASEVRGEGIFIQFDEKAVSDWAGRPTVKERGNQFLQAHAQWRRLMGIADPTLGFPGIRYVMIHSFAHALMRQLALECGYTASSIRERIYSKEPSDPDGPMAGVSLYTSAPDSEGTLGGLVSLGEPVELERHIAFALEQMNLCASDPLCSEHDPPTDGSSLHGAACHACLFVPETSCERGNKYLDRSLVVATFDQTDGGYFDL